MTLFKMGWLSEPSDFGDYFWAGSQWVLNVADRMDWATGDCPAVRDRAVRKLLGNETDVPADEAQFIALVFAGDSNWIDATSAWLAPHWWVAYRFCHHTFSGRLRTIAELYKENLDTFRAPQFSRPEDVVIGGRDGRDLTGVRRLFADQDYRYLSTSLLHVEYYTQIADRLGLEVDDALVAKTFRQAGAYFTGERDRMDPDVAEFQAVMFEEDGQWAHTINDRYNMHSRIFERAGRQQKQVAEDIRESCLQTVENTVSQ